MRRGGVAVAGPGSNSSLSKLVRGHPLVKACVGAISASSRAALWSFCQSNRWLRSHLAGQIFAFSV